jgi:predicted O-methyltransferase YrrM
MNPLFAKHISIDDCHMDFILGCLSAKKPKNVLEIGMGTGFLTRRMFYTLKHNTSGHLTVVDNWVDFGGHMPQMAKDMAREGITFVTSDEKSFVQGSLPQQYDFVVSDADHGSSDDRFYEIRRMVTNGGFMFFHDTNNNDFPTLKTFPLRAAGERLPFYHFVQNSRHDERCERGLLFVINSEIAGVK